MEQALWRKTTRWETTGINESPNGPCEFPSSRISRALPGLLFGLDDALNRANRDALRRVMMALALHTGCLVDDIQHAITFADRLGWALGNACTASDALFGDLHGHGKRLLLEISHLN